MVELSEKATGETSSESQGRIEEGEADGEEGGWTKTNLVEWPSPPSKTGLVAAVLVPAAPLNKTLLCFL